MFKVGQMRVKGQGIQDKVRVMIIKAGLGGENECFHPGDIALRLDSLPHRASCGNRLTGFNIRKITNVLSY